MTAENNVSPSYNVASLENDINKVTPQRALSNEEQYFIDQCKAEYFILLCNYCMAQSKYELALEFANTAENICKPNKDNDLIWKLLYLDSQENKAIIWYRQGRYDLAWPTLSQVYANFLILFGVEYWRTVLAKDYMNRLVSMQGNFSTDQQRASHAEKYRMVSHRTAQWFGKDHIETAKSLDAEAGFLIQIGELNQSKLLYENAIAICKANNIEKSQTYASLLNNMANLCCEQKDYETALEYYQKSSAIYKDIHGQFHDIYVNILNNIAALYVSMKNHSEVLPLYEQALFIMKTIHGSQHYKVAGILNNIASLYRRELQYDRAEKYFLDALEIQEKVLGPEHPNLGATYNNLGALYYSTGKLAHEELQMPGEGQVVTEADVKIIRETLNLAFQKLAISQKHLESGIKIRKIKLGDQHPHTKITYAWLETLAIEKEKLQEKIDAANGFNLNINTDVTDRPASNQSATLRPINLRQAMDITQTIIAQPGIDKKLSKLVYKILVQNIQAFAYTGVLPEEEKNTLITVITKVLKEHQSPINDEHLSKIITDAIEEKNQENATAKNIILMRR